MHRPSFVSKATKCALSDRTLCLQPISAYIRGGHSVWASWLRNLPTKLPIAGQCSGRSAKLIITSKVRISCCVRSLDAAHLVRSPCKLEMEISIIFWMSSHWCSAAIAAPPPPPPLPLPPPPPPLSLSGCSSLSTIFPPLAVTLSIPQHWARLEGLESNCQPRTQHMQQSSDAATYCGS